MPHSTFTQVAKRRLTGKEGRERIREVQSLLGELPGHLHGRTRTCASGSWRRSRTRGSARAPWHREIFSIAVPPEGAAQMALVGPPMSGSRACSRSILREIQNQDRRLSVRHAPTDPSPHPHRRRAAPARRDPRADRGRLGGAAAAAGRCWACSARPWVHPLAVGRTPSAPRAPRTWPRDHQHRPQVERLAATRTVEANEPFPCTISRAAFPDLEVVPVSIIDEASLDAFRDAVVAPDRPLARSAPEGRLGRSRSRSRSIPVRP